MVRISRVRIERIKTGKRGRFYVYSLKLGKFNKISKFINKTIYTNMIRHSTMLEVKESGKEKSIHKKVRNYLHNISEAIEKLSHEELHVSGENDRFYLLSSLSKNNEVFFVNLAIITTDQRKQVQIDTDLFDWLTKHQLFSTHECDCNRRPLTKNN